MSRFVFEDEQTGAQQKVAPSAAEGRFVFEDAPQTPWPEEAIGGVRSARETFLSRQAIQNLRRDPGIDYESGIPDVKFRSLFGAMMNERQRTGFMNKTVGVDNWDIDSWGKWYVKPEGLKKIGIESKTPRTIEEAGVTGYDVADIAGDLPAFLGGTAGGFAARGMGALRGMAASGLGAGAGQATTEGFRALAGHPGTPEETRMAIGGTAALGALGEGGARALMGVGRKIVAPGVHRMTPEREKVLKDALSTGFNPTPGQIRGGMITRYEGLIRKMFGDFNEPKNVAATVHEMARLKQQTGARVAGDLAEAVRGDIIEARKMFGQVASTKYAPVENLPIVPSQPMKQRAEEILESFPVTAAKETAEGEAIKGSPVFASPETLKFIKDIADLSDEMTVGQAQQIRTVLRDSSALKDLAPGLSVRHANILRESVEEAFEEAAKRGDPQAIKVLREADEFYKKGINEFDRQTLNRLVKDPSSAAALDPDTIMDFVIRPHGPLGAARVDRYNLIKRHLKPETVNAIKGNLGETIIDSAVKDAPDVFNKILDGQALKSGLDRYGSDLLKAVMGEQWTKDAYKLANSMKLVSYTHPQSGGIVAASLMLHPIKNLPKLAYINAFGRLLTTPGGLKYFTTGYLQGPKTKAGAEAITRTSVMLSAMVGDETQQNPLEVMKRDVERIPERFGLE